MVARFRFAELRLDLRVDLLAAVPRPDRLVHLDVDVLVDESDCPVAKQVVCTTRMPAPGGPRAPVQVALVGAPRLVWAQQVVVVPPVVGLTLEVRSPTF